VGAAALFLPVVSRISARTDLPLSRLLMPMGFCAILGGTMTLVGSSPLILLNDLIITANEELPADAQMETFGLFSVTPIGVALVLTGILYFVLFGRWVLPKTGARDDGAAGQSMSEYMKRLYGLDADVFEVEVPAGSILISQTFDDLMAVQHVYVVGSYYQGTRYLSPVLNTVIEGPCRLAIMGERSAVEDMALIFGLILHPKLTIFSEDFAATKAGVAEIVIPPDSAFIGKSAAELEFRKGFGLNLLAIHRSEETLSLVETEDKLKSDRNFVIVTADFPQEELRPQKVGWALFFFVIALGLILFSDLRLSLALLVGAVGMIVTRVLSVDEAYEAVGWNTVFLLASLIPLGRAVQSTGTAEWIAQNILIVLDGWPIWGLQVGIAVLATVFTLVMSNVGATVLLVPLAVSIAMTAGADPAIFAMTVAISTSNSFLIPTHQVNALIMGPAGFHKIQDKLVTEC